MIGQPALGRFKQLCRAPFSTLPIQTLYFLNLSVCAHAERLARTEAFDLAHVQLIRMAPVAAALGRLPKVLDLIDALSLNMDRRARRQRGPLSLFFRIEANRVSHYERALTHEYDRLVISSQTDRLAIGDYPNLHVVPNGVDLASHPFVGSGRHSAMLVFSGRMAYFPNVDAVIWFVREVFPHVRRELPLAQFYIIGANPPRAVRRLAAVPGVTVTGFVTQIQTYLTRATLAVAPMQAGSGMQFKVIEAMACGTPVVATPYGLGGLDVKEGEHVLVAQTAKSFAANIVRLVRDDELRGKIAAKARTQVERCYAWERTVERLEEVYRLAVA